MLNHDSPTSFHPFIRISPLLHPGHVTPTAVDEEVLGELVNKLYGCLEAGGLLGRHFRYRSQVLRAVFRLVDRENGALLAAIARVMLAVSDGKKKRGGGRRS